MYKKHNKHNKRIIIVTIVLVFFSIITLVTNRSSSSIEIMIKDTVANIEYYCLKAPINFVTGLFEEYTALKDVYEENARLKKELDKLVKDQAMNEVLAEELKQLQELTDIDWLPTDYNVKYATVNSRDVENWNSQIQIDLGENAGISEGMAVITAKGMIGTVTSVSEVSSTVTLLSTEKSTNQLPVMILSGENRYYGLLDNYDLTTGTYRLQLLSNVKEIEKDSKVVTSGLGGNGKTPKGILIGTVEQYSMKDEAMVSICNVKPSVDFDDLSYIAVVQKVNE